MQKINKYIFVLPIICLGIFTFYDLEISMHLYNNTSVFGKIFEAFGELPVAYVGCFSAMALLVTSKKNAAWKYYLTISMFGIWGCLQAFMSAFMIGKHTGLPSWAIAALAICTLIIMYILAKNVPVKYSVSLRQAAIVGIVLSFAAIFVITILKMIWGRLRFRSMSQPANEFTPWYLLQGFTTDNEHMSFPSGHSANSSVILWITLLPMFIHKLRGKEHILQLLAITWFVLVMVSRVIMGAHFASDVTMGMLISTSMFVLFKKTFIRKVT